MNFKQSNSDKFSVYENKVLIALTNYLRQIDPKGCTHTHMKLINKLCFVEKAQLI